MQYRGTQQMGAVFGPVMALWFATLGLLGLSEIFAAPEVLGAVSPHHAAIFCSHPTPSPPSSPWARWCWR